MDDRKQEPSVGDFIKEQEDSVAAANQAANIEFKRPPRTRDEALNTLKEADQRYEGSRKFLYGAEYLERESRKR